MRWVPAALDPAPGPAREWLRRELSRPDYQPNLVDRFRDWVGDLFDRVRDASAAVGGLSPVVSVTVLVILAILGALLLSRLRRDPAGTSDPPVVFGETRRSAEEHRELARVALVAEDWTAAVVETTRALAAGLFERRLLDEEARATAHEIAAGAGHCFPDLRERLGELAALFDETLYGDRHPGAERAHEAVRLERDVSTGDPRPGAVRAPVSAVPR